MKLKIVFLICLNIGLTLNGQEHRTVLFAAENNEKSVLLNANDSITTSVVLAGVNKPTEKMLRIVGGIQIPGIYKERGETYFRRWEYHMDDFLDSVHVKNDKYALLFRGENDNFPRTVSRRISGTVMGPGEIEVTAWVKRDGFEVRKPEDFGITMELFFEKQGRSENDIYDIPDSCLFIPVPSGDGGFKRIKQRVVIPENIAAMVVTVGGERFSGDCVMEAPQMSRRGKLIADIPFGPFSERDSEFNYWTGVNMVSRNWPEWKLDIDGMEVFRGKIFDRASNVADFYIPLPDEVRNGSRLTLKFLKEPGAAFFPYELKAVEMIEQPAGILEVISPVKYVFEGKPFGILVETQTPLKLTFETSPGIQPLCSDTLLKDSGLHVLQFVALEAGTREFISIKYGRETKTVPIPQVLVKESDDVFISDGDDIYIDLEEPFYSHYFKWYIGQRIGNFFQFRPSYQWSGLRKPDSLVLNKYLNLLQDLSIPYAWQVEGRTLAGKHLNPSMEALASPLFHGKQAHENDGGYYYWRHFKYEGQYSDMAARSRPYGGIFAKHRPIFTEKGGFIHYDPNKLQNMKEGAEYFVENIAYSKGESTRHTGPSTLFRYFYQAGYNWLGAEQMYGPEETIMSALRGASRAYQKPFYGSLHAMQWGSGPYTDPKHAHRFYLSLATAYIHGSSHINTEDGLWIDEYANDRFSEAGKAHIKVQHQMLDFIETHQRRGRQVVDIAVLQGRNCGWKSFVRGPLWSQNGDKWAFNKATESFDLLNVYYPQNIMNACGPEGWFTSTPFGAVDILPIEASSEILSTYKTIIFLGWNTFNASDFKRLTDFVSNGGTLILSGAHLNEELAPDLPPRFPQDDEAIKNLLGKDYREWHKPGEITRGSGKIIYFPTQAYPAEDSLRDLYEETMKAEGTKSSFVQRDKGWIIPDENVSFTAWDDDQRRTLYLLNVDWNSHEANAKATFWLGNSSFDISPRPHQIEVITVRDGLAVLPGANTTDILSMDSSDNGWTVKVQTTGEDSLRWFNGQTGKSDQLFIHSAGIHIMEIAR